MVLGWVHNDYVFSLSCIDPGVTPRGTQSNVGLFFLSLLFTPMSFESLAESLGQLGDKFGDLHKQMEDLNDVNDSLIRFNKAFGAFLFGMQATSTSLEWPEVIPPSRPPQSL